MLRELTVRLAGVGAIGVALLGDPPPGGRDLTERGTGKQTEDGVGIGLGMLPPLLSATALFDEAFAAPMARSQSLQLGCGFCSFPSPARPFGHRRGPVRI